MSANERIEEMQREVATDLTRWQYRGDLARRTRVAEMLAEVMMAVEAGDLPEARAAMQRLVDLRESYRAEEAIEAERIRAERSARWYEMRNAVIDSGILTEQQADALDEVVSRTAASDDVDAWLDERRGMGFEEMLRREASPGELVTLTGNDTLRRLLHPDDAPRIRQDEGLC